jgi:poly-beta-hydroxybutyrate-responsive repressor
MPTAEPAGPSLPRNFLRPCVLLLLREQPAHGYELLERLSSFGFSRDDPGRLYRTLRALEREGHVRSAWERSQSGPDRRIYEVTRKGVEELHETAKGLVNAADVVELFLSRYAEFAEIRPKAVPVKSEA